MTWVDIGVNLANKQFRKDAAEVVAAARAVGVEQILVTGTSVATSRAAAALAREHGLKSTAGVHPHDASRCGEGTLDELRALASLPEVVAVGECGLDFNRNYSPPEVQEIWLTRQLALAVELQLPVFLHERDAFPRLHELLEPWWDQLPGGVVHCFTGSEEALDAYLALGCSIGVTGWICDERRGAELQRLVARIPLDRILLETDAPYLFPRDLGRGRNEPRHLPHIGAVVARHMGVGVDELARASTANARSLFAL